MKRISITVKPTNDCNMRCKHCYHAEEGFEATMLNPDSVKKMMDIAIKDYEEIHIILHGGEPTLWGVDNVETVLYAGQILEKVRNIHSQKIKLCHINYPKGKDWSC